MRSCRRASARARMSAMYSRAALGFSARRRYQSRSLVRPLKTFDLKPGGTLQPRVEWGCMRPKEVSMRPPSVFVRALAPAEGQRLKRLSRQAKHASTRQRAAILLASANEMSAPEIADIWMTDESHVRKGIHDFNEHGV